MTYLDPKKMYELYDKEGILRFVNLDKDACIAYAELFELSSTNYSLMNMIDISEKNQDKNSNLSQNQAECSN